MKNKVVLLVFAFLLINCKKEVKEPEIKTDTIAAVIRDSTVRNIHNSQNSLDWMGTYKGVTPCADCDGIKTELILNSDLTFIKKTEYLGKVDSKVLQESGSFVWDNSGRFVSLQGLNGSPAKYKVEENQLIQLDMKGKLIEGDLAKKYVLTK